MACLEIRGPGDERQVIPENTPYPVGWSFTGAITWDCSEPPSPAGPGVEEELAKRGLKLGDAIAWTTKRLGIKQCGPCKARQEILNRVSEVGWAETIKQIRETF